MMYNGIFDTHSHYDDEQFDEDREQLLVEIHSNGVSHIIDCGCDLKSSIMAVEMSKKYDFIYAACGIHPESVPCSSEEEQMVFNLIEENKVVAIGEIGLDYHWDNPRDEQIRIFKKQIEFAKDLDLPIIVHDREAHGDTLDILKYYKPKGVLHCFSGSVEMMNEIVKLGMNIGIGGSVTFKNAKVPLMVAQNVPLDRLLLETDCPYMAPVPFRGKRCDSTMISYVAEKIAELRNESPQKIIDIANENARRLFNI